LATPVRVSRAVEDNLTAVDTVDDNRSLAAGTNDNNESEHTDGNEPAFPLDFEPVDEEPQQLRRYEVQVAPINAPKQVAYVPAKESGKNKTFNCYYFPFCKKKRHECGGNERGKCRDIISGKIKDESDEAIRQAKILERNKARNEMRKAKKAK
jgi:hypothetical protein